MSLSLYHSSHSSPPPAPPAPPRPSPQMHCCGVTDYRDWFLVLGENTVPDRCCMENSQGCGQNNTTLVWRTVRLGTPGAPGWTVWVGAGVAQDTTEVAYCGVGEGTQA